MTENVQRFDIVVVGGGMAGLIAGVRGAELGKSVVVLEQGVGDRYPCNARYSGGIFHIAYNDVKVPEPRLVEAALEITDRAADPSLINVLARNGKVLVDWMTQQGVRFIRGPAEWQNWMLAPPRPIKAGMEWMGRGPDVALRRLGERLSQLGGKLQLGTRATSLIMKDGRCVGVEAECEGKPVSFNAGAVILADGGFQANHELVAKYICGRPDRLKMRGAPTGIGSALQMGQAVGAGVTRLDLFYGHLLSRDSMHSDRVWPYPELDGIAAASIMVDADGRRFADEGLGGIYLSNAVARLSDPLATSIVFDSKIWEGPGRSARIPANPELAKAGGTIFQAANLNEVAEKAGLPAAALTETVSAYNKAVNGKALQALSPARSARKAAAMPIETAPFFVIPVCAGITATMGGLMIDDHARVLTPDRKVISALYAAGTSFGGTDGGDVAGYVGGLIQAGVFGMLAVQDAAGQPS